MAKLGPYDLNTIVTGDARVLSEAIPDCSVDLIFTDPVYWQIEDYLWLARIAKRVLKDGASVLAFCGHSQTQLASSAMLLGGLGELKPGPVLEHYVAGSVGRLFSHSIQCNVLPCLWYSKGQPSNDWMALQERSVANGNRGHDWGKAEYMAQYRISRFTVITDIVVDPFCGGGSIPAMAKQLGRNYLAFEIDPATAALARERVANTQPPLPFEMPEQLPLERSVER